MKHRLITLLGLCPLLLGAAESPRQFVGWTHFEAFERGTNAAGEVTWLSPRTTCRPADEFVSSWNASLPSNGWLNVELRVFHNDTPTRFYALGHWSLNPAQHPRASIPGQQDADGDVDTDTLQLRAPANAFQFRLTLGATTNAAPLKLLAVSLINTRLAVKPRASLRSVWGQYLTVPERSQHDYAEGGGWCSPTTVTMLLGFWAAKLHRSDLLFTVPDVAHAIYDATWKGTGNWSFNVAFAGEPAGLRACVTRFDDVRELEEWIAHGYPVGVSICYDRLRDVGPGPNGHLMVVAGFTKTGDVVFNDPAGRQDVRRVFSRERFLYAWKYSKNTVYLVYPEGAVLPPDRFGHWSLNP
jgi:hypothetical protein